VAEESEQEPHSLIITMKDAGNLYYTKTEVIENGEKSKRKQSKMSNALRVS
jgi:hypothetical protein